MSHNLMKLEASRSDFYAVFRRPWLAPLLLLLGFAVGFVTGMASPYQLTVHATSEHSDPNEPVGALPAHSTPGTGLVENPDGEYDPD